MSFKEFLGGDWTPLEHVAIALAVQCGICLACLPFFGWTAAVCAGTAAGAAFFCGREHAQAERRIMDSKGLSLNAATLQALKFWEWNRGSVMDMVCPFVAVLVAGLAALLFV